MITRIDRYVFRQIILALFAVTLGLALLIWLTQSLRFVELVVNRGLSFAVFLRLTSLLLPSVAAVILPITTFVVVLFVYQRMASDRELTAMCAAGMSPIGLARPALAVATIAMAASYLLNLWLVPTSLASFREHQSQIRNSLATLFLQEGVFTRVTDDLTVYVRIREQDGTLRDIMLDDRRLKTRPSTTFAQTGRLLEASTGLHVLLLNGSRQEIDRETGRLSTLQFSENIADLTQSLHPGAARSRNSAEVSLDALLNPDPTTVSAREIPLWRVEGHKRLATPLTALSYTLLALLASLTGSFHRHSGIVRPALATVAMVTLLATGLAIGSLAARDTTLIPLLWLHAAAPGLVAVWLLFVPRPYDLRATPPLESPS